MPLNVIAISSNKKNEKENCSNELHSFLYQVLKMLAGNLLNNDYTYEKILVELPMYLTHCTIYSIKVQKYGSIKRGMWKLIKAH